MTITFVIEPIPRVSSRSVNVWNCDGALNVSPVDRIHAFQLPGMMPEGTSARMKARWISLRRANLRQSGLSLIIRSPSMKPSSKAKRNRSLSSDAQRAVARLGIHLEPSSGLPQEAALWRTGPIDSKGSYVWWPKVKGNHILSKNTKVLLVLFLSVARKSTRSDIVCSIRDRATTPREGSS